MATAYEFDVFGNVKKVTVTPVSGQGQSERVTAIDWGATGQFPVSVTNPKLQVTTLGWDYAKGVRTSMTDPNLLTTTLQYDEFARVTRQTRPDGTALGLALSSCNAGNSYCGVSDLRFSLQMTMRDTADAVIRSETHYFDGFDRARYDNQQILGGADSTVITSYDALGRVAWRSVPKLPADPLRYTSYSYDLIGRQTLIRRPTSEADLSDHDDQFSYQGLTVAYTDALGHITQRIMDGLGQVVHALDAANNETDYEYDAFGNLLKVRDADNNEIVNTYNIRGMKLTMSDPDMGNWSYSYFPFGELKSQTDAKLQQTLFTYDELSRPLTREETEATTTFTWDTAPKGIGQLGSVWYGTNYSEAYSYDALGRTAQISITTESITHQYDYAYQATTGLLDTLTYPVNIGGERFKIRHGYQNGYLASVQSYIADVAGTTLWQSQGMTARGQTTLEQFGNGVQVSSGYDGLRDGSMIASVARVRTARSRTCNTNGTRSGA